MSTTYTETLKQVRSLDPEDQLRLLEDITMLLRQSLARHSLTPKSRRSILELRGLGKEIWEGLDAQSYVEQERASWNG
jgi:hypothetical protein